MGSRVELQSMLEDLLGSANVYFQPPSTHKMKYPCIVYSRSDVTKENANNDAYRVIRQYRVTVIDPNPDSLIPDKVLALPNSSFINHFTKDNLNHDIYNIYY